MLKNNLTKRKLQSLKSREKIFGAAISLIKKKGFEQVTIEEIITEAKVSTGSFYNYFNSKDQIILEQFLEIDKYYKKIVKKDLRDYRGIDKLLNFVIFQMRYSTYRMGKDLLRNVYRSLIMTSNMGHIMLDEHRFLYKFLSDTIEEAQEMGELSGDLNNSEIAHYIAVLMRGITYNWCLHERDFNLEKTAIKVISTFLKGLNVKG
jgi:TetR/AcrR family transcriptional regulator, fatty acid metabolism regulator protein